jgi:hypothetical protein
MAWWIWCVMVGMGLAFGGITHLILRRMWRREY